MFTAPLKKTKYTVSLIAVLALVFFLWLAPPQADYETIFYGGPIITMNPDAPEAEALLMRGEHILAVGSLEQVRAKAFGSPAEIDLAGRALLPGLIEPHTHPLATAMLGETIDVSGFSNNTRGEIIARILQGVEETPSSRWVMAYGWDPVMMPDLDPPILAELDSWSPHRPLVILTQMMHDAYANSAALEAAGITADTPNPPGAEFIKDKNGKLTGTVREVAAISALFDAAPAPPAAAAEFLLARQYSVYARAGYTTIGILGPVGRSDDPIGAMKKVAKGPNAPVRSLIYALPTQLPQTTSSPEDHNQDAPIIGVKFWMDGSPFAGGAAFAEPYEDTPLVKERLHLGPGHMADLNYGEEEFQNAFRKFHIAGYQIAVHAQGERAIDRVLDIAGRVLMAHPRTDHRHRLEHNALISRSQLQRARALGLTTSFFVDHVNFYGHALPDLVGDDRTARYMPVKTSLEVGHRSSVHTDNPATPINALRAMHTLRARTSLTTGKVIGGEERLTPMQALEAMTINAAWQLGIDKQTGSLEAGKYADLLLLSANPLDTADSDLQNLKVIGTWLKGQPADTRTLTPLTFITLIPLIAEMITG